MKIELYRNDRLLVSDLQPREKMEIRRTCVVVNSNRGGDALILDDNLFNRLYLNYKLPSFIYNSESIVMEAIRQGFRSELRDYQIEDLEKMLTLKNVLNCNKMGYGKTLEAIEYCRMLGLRKIVVLCPKAIIEQWRDQFIKWWPETENIISSEPPKITDKGTDYRDGLIFVTNYEWLRNNEHLSRLRVFPWDIVICDESHKIKNKDSKLAQAVKLIPTIHKMALTGTPILNKPNDLWSQLNWFGPFFSSSNYWEFSKNFCDWDNRYGFQFLGLTSSGSRKNLLGQGLEQISVGGQIRQITEGKNYIDIPLTMTGGQRKLYAMLKKEAVEALEAEGITITSAMDVLVKMMQVTSNPAKLNPDLKNPKFEWIEEIMNNCDGKLVVFTKHAETAKALEQYIGEKQCLKYIGSMNMKERITTLEKFKNPNDESKILVGTIGALGIGVDGLQLVSHNVIFIDKDWSPSLNEQAEDRVNRFGQRDMVNVYTLKIKGTIDMHIEQVINKKNLDIEELRECIQLYA